MDTTIDLTCHVVTPESVRVALLTNLDADTLLMTKEQRDEMLSQLNAEIADDERADISYFGDGLKIKTVKV